jgi:hypothetical protein
MQSIRFTLPISASDTRLVWVRLRLRFVDILVKMWLLKAFFLVILPVPVMLKRFLALELVFIFGMSVFICLFNIFCLSDVIFETWVIRFFSQYSNLISQIYFLAICLSDVRYEIFISILKSNISYLFFSSL